MDCNQAGRAGEFYIAYVLEKNGIECHHVDLKGTDLWCQLENGKMFTVQVKSATTSFRNKGRWIYSFCLATTKKADFTIFLALDQERFIVETAEQVGKRKSKQVIPRAFTTTKQAEGIELLKGFFQDDGNEAK